MPQKVKEIAIPQDLLSMGFWVIFRLKIPTIMLFVMVTVLSACEQGRLTREIVKERILSTENLNELRIKIPFFKNAYDEGVALGFWTRKHGIYSQVGLLTDKGKKWFRNLYWEGVSPLDPVDISLEVTGIRDEPITGEKHAEFVWRYKSLPRHLKVFAIAGGHGEALFRRYDDGWRIVGINVFSSNSPIVLTEEDNRWKADLKNVFKAEFQQSKIALQKEVEKAELYYRSNLEKSRKPTKSLYIEIDNKSPTVGGGIYNQKKVFDITDVGIKITTKVWIDILKKWNIQEKYIWYGDLSNIGKRQNNDGQRQYYYLDFDPFVNDGISDIDQRNISKVYESVYPEWIKWREIYYSVLIRQHNEFESKKSQFKEQFE